MIRIPSLAPLLSVTFPPPPPPVATRWNKVAEIKKSSVVINVFRSQNSRKFPKEPAATAIRNGIALEQDAGILRIDRPGVFGNTVAAEQNYPEQDCNEWSHQFRCFL